MRNKLFNFVLIIFVLLILFNTKILYAQNSQQIRGFGETWVATDALGRSLPTYKKVGPTRTNKYVGVFYFLWTGTPGGGGDTAIYDNSKLIQKNPDHPAYGPRWAFHWWGEPEAGYYRAEDPWVIRRNLQMLSDVGVDFLYFDVTNGFTYLNVVNTLCSISMQMRQEGIPTPHICFLTHTNSGQVINQLYSQFYRQTKYSDLWFTWNGKPLILGDIKDTTLSNDAKNFFTFRNSWAWMDETISGQWQWIDYYPQDYAWDINPQTPEQISVSVASHPVLNIGESYHDGAEPPLNKYKITPFTGEGLYFAEQWKRALKVDPPVIMITGWNEWEAIRFIAPEDGNPNFLGRPAIEAPESTFFADNYNAEFNRDIEPMMGGYTDNHYYQLVANIRWYKGVPPLQAANGIHNISIDGNFSDWENVQPVFYDPKGDTEHRNWYRYDNKETYVNYTGRNDIIESRVAYDTAKMYFYVKTDTALTPYTDKNWMLLFINADMNKATGWEGYDYVVNLNVKSDLVTTLAAWHGQDSSWNEIANLQYSYKGNQIEIRVPRNLINQTAQDISFYFHWADNIQKLNDITEFFIDGDSAPDRRFNYHFTTIQIPTSVTESLSLSQNYPNPFNPTTVIKYSVPTSGYVTLKIYNLMGQEVAALVNGQLMAGSYKTNFDASKLSSGVYFYKLNAGGFMMTKKMMLLK